MDSLAQLRESFYSYINNQSNADEAAAFLKHLQSGQDKEAMLLLIEECLDSPVADHVLAKPEIIAAVNDTYLEILAKMDEPQVAKHNFQLWRKIAVAVSLLLVVGFGGYFYSQKAVRMADLTATNTDVAPGKNKATLTLANGKKIVLSDAVKGELAEENGISITKTQDGQIVYRVANGALASDQLKYNTLTTARGEQYQVILPDGTKVWLNAASSLKFPSTFAKVSQRKVELTGEAYFEVAKDKTHPFKVASSGQEVEVLGTHFNINSYEDDPTIKTTLLEGSIRVIADKIVGKKGVIIKPGEQTRLTAKGIEIVQIDVEQAIDWKNGDFSFQQESLTQLMKRVSRWYNMNVEYQKDVDKEQTFTGQVSRSKHLSELLKNLESIGNVRFKIEGDKITVMN